MTAGNVFLADCPARLAVEIIADKWAAEAPPRVEYELTELGRTLVDPIRMLAQWAETNGDAVLDAQDRE